MRFVLSLKYILITLFLLSTLAPIIVVGGISYYSMNAILDNKAKKAAFSNLYQVRVSLENTLSQLNHVSQMLSYDGRVGKNLERFIAETDPYRKKEMYDEMISELNLINFTNPSIGLTCYYFANENKYLFANFPLRSGIDLNDHPLLSRFSKVAYFGPHKSANPQDGNQVLSVLRHVELPERNDVYVYVETNFKMAETILQNQQVDVNVSHLVVDNNGIIAFSENTKDFPKGSAYLAENYDLRGSKPYYLFEEKSNQSWKVVAAISKISFEQETQLWQNRYAMLFILSLLLSCSSAWIIWRVVYRPLNRLIRNLRHTDLRKPFVQQGSPSIVEEFLALHSEFVHMRKRIVQLVDDVEAKERNKSLLEVEKLMHQINPHFIHNSLDTIRWIARSNGQKEIDKMVSALNKLIHYNLGKGGPAIIQDEIEALKNYVMLQQIRYDFHFKVNIHADPQVLELYIPRFVLQPLVENALYHGLDDQGVIELSVSQREQNIFIEVKDNGAGMSAEKIRELLEPPSEYKKKVGMGIGLAYVQRMIHFAYGSEASFKIESEPGVGTTVSLQFPVRRQNRLPSGKETVV